MTDVTHLATLLVRSEDDVDAVAVVVAVEVVVDPPKCAPFGFEGKPIMGYYYTPCLRDHGFYPP